MTTYLYGITFADHPGEVDGLRGVGPSPTPARMLPAGEALSAVVGDVQGELRAKRRDLLAHQQVLQVLCDGGPTLPMRFGVLAADDEAVAQAVAEKADVYAAILRRVRGHVEMNVKVAHREEAVLGQLLAGDDTLRQLAENIRTHPGGPQDEQIRFGELVAGRLAERERTDADAILEHLLPLASEHSPGPAVDGCFFNVSFLVSKDRVAEFGEATQWLAGTVEAVAEVRTQGPLPPYSFTGED
ncbi:GvpL/GvpF family gas vesicle protein [Amycolatopsis jiangsuensis]|uniref:Gas vesicle protein GvpL/GvpF n=1 Tax=Amycolatopsis jiangsuensis TaxID=1181879 RepID=A0A840IYL9_9PSEU|nr:GvpL/GvpF family gas vesicle protein [Amycolatopsis jiangsuensis]MBB4686238.1 hypothetical protein [Amycolatopsis jiangsuensis]